MVFNLLPILLCTKRMDILIKSSCAANTIPVPRLVGQEWMNPYLASNMKSLPDSFFTLS